MWSMRSCVSITSRPLGRHDDAVEQQLTDQAEEEAARQVNQQRAVREGAVHFDLHHAL